MKSIFILGTITLLLAGSADGQDKGALKTQKDKVSYTIGLDIGKNMKRQMIDLDLTNFTRGIQDGLQEAKPALTDEEMREVMTDFQKEVMARLEENTKKLGAKNKKEGDAYLAENKKKPGVKTLASGLQYKVITEGKGRMPKKTDTVVVNYRGTLIDGKEFDSSYRGGQPVTFPVNRMIPGWVEALLLMKEGSKWELTVPSNLCYGETGAGQDIGPNATLLFEIELIKVK